MRDRDQLGRRGKHQGKGKFQIRSEYKLPKELEGVVRAIFDNKGCENASLQIHKFVPFGYDDEKKKDGLPKPRYDKFGYKIELPPKTLQEYQSFFQVQNKLWEFKGAEIFPEKTKSRLIVGLGDESVYETSIRLHRNYGVPYIPGSALKGITKHIVILKIAEKLQKHDKEKDFFELAKEVQDWFEGKGKLDEVKDCPIKVNGEENSAEELRNIFGTQKQEGLIIFFDAFPDPENSKPILELDIMNPHYQPYYQGSTDPGDWHKPNPIFFLTVPTDITFTFAVAHRNGDGKEPLEIEKKALFLLKEALKEIGVGAKTASGYGRFKL